MYAKCIHSWFRKAPDKCKHFKTISLTAISERPFAIHSNSHKRKCTHTYTPMYVILSVTFRHHIRYLTVRHSAFHVVRLCSDISFDTWLLYVPNIVAHLPVLNTYWRGMWTIGPFPSALAIIDVSRTKIEPPVGCHGNTLHVESLLAWQCIINQAL